MDAGTLILGNVMTSHLVWTNNFNQNFKLLISISFNQLTVYFFLSKLLINLLCGCNWTCKLHESLFVVL